jgi:hypothetical protein
MNVTRDGDRLVLGDKSTVCHSCGASAAVHYATNGKAEIWHAPTDCCDWSRARERRFNAFSLADDRRAADAEVGANARRTFTR